MATTTILQNTLEAFLKSDDFKSGLIASTRASWGDSGYSVELFEDGTWQTLWNNQIGNLYETPGVILSLPTLDDSSYQECIHDAYEPMSEEDYFDMVFANDEDELAQSMRDALAEKEAL
jgi:hypothetical protein